MRHRGYSILHVHWLDVWLEQWRSSLSVVQASKWNVTQTFSSQTLNRSCFYGVSPDSLACSSQFEAFLLNIKCPEAVGGRDDRGTYILSPLPSKADLGHASSNHL